MNKYLVRVEWSQTDSSNILVTADSRENAEKKARHAFPKGRYFTVTVVDSELF